MRWGWHFGKIKDMIICVKVIIKLILLPYRFKEKDVVVTEMGRKIVIEGEVA
jgi:hypothetical protein